MRFGVRWVANAVTIFLALYLVDTLAKGKFHVGAPWAAVILALLLGLLNSFVRPLHRARSKPAAGLLRTALTVGVNLLVLQIFVWAGAGLTAVDLGWTAGAALLISFLAGVINWLVGFKSKQKARPSVRRRTQGVAGRRPATESARKRG